MANERVPMKPKATAWISEQDVEMSMQAGPRVGRRFYMDIDELALRQIGAQGLAHAVEHLAQAIAYEHRGAIESAVVTALADPDWVKPILEDEFRKAARALVMSLWSDEEKAGLRGWFDLLTAAASK